MIGIDDDVLAAKVGVHIETSLKLDAEHHLKRLAAVVCAISTSSLTSIKGYKHVVPLTDDFVVAVAQTVSSSIASVVQEPILEVHILGIELLAGELGNRGGLDDAGILGHAGQEIHGESVVRQHVDLERLLDAIVGDAKGSRTGAGVLLPRGMSQAYVKQVGKGID